MKTKKKPEVNELRDVIREVVSGRKVASSFFSLPQSRGVGTFRFDHEYEIEYGYVFLNPVRVFDHE